MDIQQIEKRNFFSAPCAQDKFQWVATALLFGGAFLISIDPKMGANLWPFAVFALGHSILTIDSILTRHGPYLVLNISFLALDLYAVLIRI